MGFAKRKNVIVAGLIAAAMGFVLCFTLATPAHAATSTTRSAATTKATQTAKSSNKKVAMYRLHNPRTQEHLYTLSKNEKRVLVMQKGWTFEGISWYSPSTSGTPVFRLYRDGAHHYTASEHERDVLIASYGWRDEGICWYSDDNKKVKVYRLLKSDRPMASAHHYTTSARERKILIEEKGWTDEGVGWSAAKKGASLTDGWVKKNGAWTYWLEGKQVKAQWIKTLQSPTGVEGAGIQSYWIDANGKLAIDRVVNPDTSRDKKAGKLFYASSTGVMARACKVATSAGIILIDKQGKLATGKGWVTSSVYDGTSQRYYLVSKGKYSVAKTGIFTVSGAKYFAWPDEGYVMRNGVKYVGSNWYKADKNGKLSVYKTSRTEHINRYVNWAVGIANDDSHGYSQYTRWGPDYDCSSLVVSSLKATGFNVGAATYTGNMREELTKYGFKWYTNLSKIDRGDILLNETHHTAIYLGNGKQVAATISEKGTIYGKAGDQTGREITVQNYFNYPWNGFLRYEGK